MLTITREVTKKVNHPSQLTAEGKPVIVTRKATINSQYVDPNNEEWYDEALALCGGDAALVARIFNNGMWRVIQQWETNNLGKGDNMSKGLEKAINGLVQTGIYTAESARTLLMSNPATAKAFGEQKFEQFITVDISDFAAYQLSEPDEKGVRKSRYPDVTDIGAVEEETAEESK
jgi:hypothetical protein